MKKCSILSNESGQGLTEYLVLLILISIASITIVTQMGNAVEGRFRAAKEKINSLSVNGDDDGGGKKSKLDQAKEAGSRILGL
jgi:Flp pilus assembly pilin Flp